MRKNCHTPERNMCAPDGKIAALFVDIDGTVMECQKYFDTAVNEFAMLMSLCGFSRKIAKQTLEQSYYGSMPHRGFERENFGKAIAEAYGVLCKASGKRRNREVALICQRIGSAPFFNEPDLFPHALPVLTRARHNFLLVAVTVGSREVQKYKIRQGGFASVFDDIIITLNENKAELVGEFIEDLGVHPHHSAFIGNSVRSDGVTLSKTNFVYLPLETSLAGPNDRFPESKFRLFRTENWLDVEERVLNRLIRRRRNAAELDFSAGAENPAEAKDALDHHC